MSWREQDERRRAREKVEAKLERDSEGVRLHNFFRLLAAPLALVIWLVLSGTRMSGTVLIAFAALAVVILIALLKAIWPSARRRDRKPAAKRGSEPQAQSEPTVWDRVS